MGSLFLKRNRKRKQTKQKNQPMHFSTTEYVLLCLVITQTLNLIFYSAIWVIGPSPVHEV